MKSKRINADVFVHPENYLVCLPAKKIVTDIKVHRQIVERYKRRIASGESVSPIVVIKNPREDIYAILDGHHRYYAYLESGTREMQCAFAGDFSFIFFVITKIGFFQPTVEIIEYIEYRHHKGVGHYFGKGLRYSRLLFQNMRMLSIGISFTPTSWTSKKVRLGPLRTEGRKKDYRFKVLFVCTGNAYRSPICEALLKKLRPDLEVDSAGTKIVNEITKEAREYLTSQDASQYLKKTPESIDSKQLEKYDIIIAMEQSHRDAILKKCPECKNKVVIWDIQEHSARELDKIPFLHGYTDKINNQMKKKVTEYGG